MLVMIFNILCDVGNGVGGGHTFLCVPSCSADFLPACSQGSRLVRLGKEIRDCSKHENTCFKMEIA